MENATKALSIAGAILITIIIIALGAQVYNGIQELPMSEEERLEAEEIEKFNSRFNIYNDKSLYKAEFKSVINKIIDNNTLYPGYQIQINIDGEEKTDIEAKDFINGEINSYWRCTQIEYTEGRISKMYFESVNVADPDPSTDTP